MLAKAKAEAKAKVKHIYSTSVIYDHHLRSSKYFIIQATGVKKDIISLIFSQYSVNSLFTIFLGKSRLQEPHWQHFYAFAEQYEKLFRAMKWSSL
jgi:hypothetical protein